MDTLKKQHPWLTESELAAYAELPKKEDGKTFDLEAMDAEQRALFYKDRAEASTAGFNSFKTTKDKELSDTKAELEALKAGGKNATLTEDELEQHVPGYAALSEGEKTLIKSTIAPLVKNLNAIAAKVDGLEKTTTDAQRFAKEFEELLEQDEYQVLAKHKKGFKDFAYTDENLNTPLDILADAYIKRNNLVPETTPGRNGLESSGGGSRNLPPKKGLTANEAAHLRTSDPKRYARLAREGKLSDAVRKGNAGIE